jgi:hypothetical protein
MSCIVVIYDGTDGAEAELVEKVCNEADPERGAMCRKIGPSAFRLQSINTQEMKLHRLRQEIKKGTLYWLRVEDDDLRSTKENDPTRL